MKNQEIVLHSYDCTGCGRCVAACRRGVLRLVDNGACRLVQVADAGLCAGCRACERSCAAGAIAIRKIEGSGLDRKRIVQGLLTVVPALGLSLPLSLDPAAWAEVDCWKIFGLLVLFHLLAAHIPYSKYLKKIDR